ncbi:MAG: FMN-binding protein [Solirubrobacteraceae bacterium]
MRRAPIVLTATVAGVAAVLSYQPHAKPAGRKVQPTGVVAAAPSTGGAHARRAPRAVPRVTTVVGADAPSQYGDVQVRVKMSGKRIVSVEAVALPSAASRSQAISTVAAPMLRRQALVAQSANLDGVSGASYTSAGYRRSLQSALDQIDSARASA